MIKKKRKTKKELFKLTSNFIQTKCVPGNDDVLLCVQCAHTTNKMNKKNTKKYLWFV